MWFDCIDPHTHSTSQTDLLWQQMRTLAQGFLTDHFDKHIIPQFVFMFKCSLKSLIRTEQNVGDWVNLKIRHIYTSTS